MSGYSIRSVIMTYWHNPFNTEPYLIKKNKCKKTDRCLTKIVSNRDHEMVINLWFDDSSSENYLNTLKLSYFWITCLINLL